MSQRYSGADQSNVSDGPGLSARQWEASTDPGRSQPFESLYRGPTGIPAQVHRTTARHYEPSLSPPEGQAESGDTFGWLYRAGPGSPTSPDGPEGTAGLPEGSSVPRLQELPGPPLADQPRGLRPPKKRLRGRRGREGRGRLTVVVVALLFTSAVVAAAVSGGTGTTAKEYRGTVERLAPDQAVADCLAAPSTDGAGSTVRYDPELLLDGDRSTAWRCAGSGVGRRLVFSFAGESRIAELGLVNGYTKVDPSTGADRYGEYRRVSEVTWTFPDGAEFRQQLQDGEESTQTLRIPVQVADRVTLTITGSTEPGSKVESRDAVLIPEASFGAPRG